MRDGKRRLVEPNELSEDGVMVGVGSSSSRESLGEGSDDFDIPQKGRCASLLVTRGVELLSRFLLLLVAQLRADRAEVREVRIE
jgi:hypothetical protein